MIKRSRRFETKRVVDLTPMIDVIFLLVIFFLTSSTLLKVKSLKIDLPESGSVGQEITKPSIISIDNKGTYFFNGIKINASTVESQLNKLIKEKKIKVLLIEGYKNLPYQKIIEVMSIAKNSGIEKVSLSVKSSR